MCANIRQYLEGFDVSMKHIRFVRSVDVCQRGTIFGLGEILTYCRKTIYVPVALTPLASAVTCCFFEVLVEQRLG
jgi:hypothetical protein